MRVTRLYYEGSITCGETLILHANASSHLVRVLRCKINRPVIIFNGEGGEYAATLSADNPKAAKVMINEYHDINRESDLNITLLQGISHSEHMDTTIQKATELGVNTIIPVICKRSPPVHKNRLQKKLERWQQIVISACEQSGRNTLPSIGDVCSLYEALSQAASQCRLVLDPDTDRGLNYLQASKSVAILCGPEGGLSADEITESIDAGFNSIKFGPRVLRTETAGPACISALQTLWGDMG